MAFVATGPVFYPPLTGLILVTGGTQFSSFLMNAAGTRVACVFQAPATGNLDHIEILTGVVTTGGVLKASFQSVNATGDPSGTAVETATVTLADTDDNVWKVVPTMTSGGNKRAVTKGDNVAAVLEFNSFVGTENLNIQGLRTILGTPNAGSVYVDTYNGTTWTKSAAAGMIYLLVYEGGLVYPISGTGININNICTLGITNSTNPNYVGNLITLPFTCKVDGIYFSMDVDADVDVALIDSTNQTLAIVRLSNAVRNTAFMQTYIYQFNEITLVPGNYRVYISPVSSAPSLTFPVITVANASHMLQYYDGVNVQFTQKFNSGGTWTNTPTKKSFLGLRISALSDTSTGGGGSTGAGVSHARAQGGM